MMTQETIFVSGRAAYYTFPEKPKLLQTVITERFNFAFNFVRPC